MNRKPSPANVLKQLPTKWAVAVVVAVLAYAFFQPVLNSRLGWSLPSVAGLSGQEDDSGKPDTSERASARGESESLAQSDAPKSIDRAEQPASKSRSKSTDTDSNSNRSSDRTDAPAAERPATDTDLKFGLLREVGNEVYLSPGGLRYTKGSQEGHRLKHVAKHLEDQPNRPGSHGVFFGDMPQVLRWLDEAYDRGNRGAKGATKRKEDARTVYEVSFDKPIGYVGGQTGGRKGKPDARRVRMVLEGDRVITAFPY